VGDCQPALSRLRRLPAARGGVRARPDPRPGAEPRAMSGWIAWVLVAAALGAGELHTGGFWLAPFAIGAVGGAIAGAVGLGAALQFVVFFAATAAAFGLIRPVARRHISMPPTLRTGAAALVGGE